jgi:hypothetical protein
LEWFNQGFGFKTYRQKGNTMKGIAPFLFILIGSFILANLILAKDEVKDNSKKKTDVDENIKDIEITGIVTQIHSSEDLPAGSNKKTTWYVLEIKGGFLVHLPEKIDGKEVDFKSLEGQEVIVIGKGKESIEKFEGPTTFTKDKDGKEIEEKGKVDFVKIPKFISLKSIQLKSKSTIK